MAAALPFDVDVVVTNGCEHTAGESLADPSGAWPKVLAEALGARLVDLSEPGGSNHRLVRTTVTGLPAIMAEHGDPRRVLFVGMWTHPDRFEVIGGRPVSSRIRWRRFNDRPWHQVTSERARDADRRSEAWYRIYRPLLGAIEVHLWALLLERWLSDLGCRSVQCAAVDLTEGVDDSFAEYRCQMRNGAYLGGADRWVLEPLWGGGRSPDAAGHRAFVWERLLPWLTGQAVASPCPARSESATGDPRRVKVVVANGDSNTWGDEHANPARTTWAAVLAERLGADLVNLAEQGGSNHRLVRTTVEHLPRILDERSLDPDEVLFVGMWTIRHRFEVIWDWAQKVNVHDPGFTDRPWHRIGTYLLARGHEPSTVWYQDLEDRQSGIIDLLLSSVLLDRWLASTGCRHAQALAYDVLQDRPGEAAQLAGQLRPGSRVGGAEWSRQALYSLLESRADLAPGGHLREASHRAYVDEHLLPWLRSSGLVP